MEIETKILESLFVPYDLAKKIKERGFNLPCLAYNNSIGEFTLGLSKPISDKKYECTSIPMFQQAIDWFREDHNISIEVYRTAKMTTGEEYGCQAERWTPQGVTDEFNYYEPTYYQALTKGIEQALTLI